MRTPEAASASCGGSHALGARLGSASKTRAPRVATASHRANLSIPKFFIDKHPATNANYSAYLAATGYKPRGPRRASNPGRADPLRLPLRLGHACGPHASGQATPPTG